MKLPRFMYIKNDLNTHIEHLAMREVTELLVNRVVMETQNNVIARNPGGVVARHEVKQSVEIKLNLHGLLRCPYGTASQ
jgi:hypothetical protein